MTGVFYFFAAVLVLLSARSFFNGLRYHRYMKDETERIPSRFTPFATVIAPCRGLDHALAENLASILRQDYPAYEVIFVVDDRNDPAVAVIDEVRRDAMPPTKLVMAPKATSSSQKVENLREAVLHIDSRSEVFAFVDSDVRVSPGWLRSLIAPLEERPIGAATGYRWFINGTPTLASEMRSAWNASIASALGPDTRSNFCWGGSMAIRRDVFEELNIREKWQGTLSDDLAVTRALQAAGRPIVFVPAALAVTAGGCTFGEFLEFTTRQMKITRVYAPRLWFTSLIGSFIFNAVLLASLLIIIFSRTNSSPVIVSLAVLLFVTVFSVGKAWVRLNAVRLALPGQNKCLRRQFWTQNTLWLPAGTVFLYNSLAALLSRRVSWRGIRYELKSPNETVIIAD